MGLSPLYSYSGGKNILRLNLPKQGMNAASEAAYRPGDGLGLRDCPARHLVRGRPEQLVGTSSSLYDFWVRMLTVLSGPVVFLMVCTSVLNTRTIEEEGGSSRRVFLWYFF